MKKFISILLAISIVLTTLIVLPMSASAIVPATDIKLGDYLEMGEYYGQPILWRCVAFEKVTGYDENNNPIMDSTQTSTTYKEGYLPLMMADRIICLKAFDASGTNTNGSHGRGCYYNGKQGCRRQIWGSNYWGDSNIRDWLNSNASAGNVVWTCGNPPDNSHVSDGYNDYANEAGFLTNFKEFEQRAIQTVTQKSLLDGYEHSTGSGNTINSNYHRWDYDIRYAVQNYANAYSEQVTDKMFLPDVKQINTVYNNIGSNYYIGIPTEEAVKNSEYKNSSLTATNSWWSWLRSPSAVSYFWSERVRSVDSDGSVYYDNAYLDDGGVRPAFYLNLTSLNLSGTGTKADPFEVTVKPNSAVIFGTEQAQIGGSVKQSVVFATDKTDVEYAIFDIKYPKNLSLKEITPKDFKYVTKDGESEEGDYKILTLTCQYSDSGCVPKNKVITPFELSFTVNQDSAVGDFDISILDTSIMIGGSDYSFAEIQNDKIKVTPKLAESVSVSGDSTISEYGEYTATVLPDYTTDKSVTWSVDNEAVATIDQSGKLTAHKNGTVTVKATAIGGAYGTKSVTVKGFATDVAVSGPSEVTDFGEYTATVLPDSIKDKSVTWSVDNESIATIDQRGKLTAHNTGTVTVKATAVGGAYGTKSVTVKAHAKINSLTSDVGIWDKTFTPDTYEYEISVPEDCGSITLTPSFTGGTLKYNGGIWLNNRSKTISLTEDETTVELKRSGDETVIDSTYTLTVKKVDPETFSDIRLDKVQSAKTNNGQSATMRFFFTPVFNSGTVTSYGAYIVPLWIFEESGTDGAALVNKNGSIEKGESYSVDLKKIPSAYFDADIMALPFITIDGNTKIITKPELYQGNTVNNTEVKK